MKRVLYVVNSPQAFLESRRPLAVAAKARGYDPEVAVADGPALAAKLAGQFKVHDWRVRRRQLNPFAEAKVTANLRRILIEARPQLMHAIAWKAIVHGGVAARMAGIPAVVHTVAGLGYAFSSKGLKPRAVRLVLRTALSVIAKHPNVRFIVQNPDDEELLGRLGLDRAKITLIRSSGVDLQRFKPSDERDETPIVVFPSRLLWSKGVQEFVDAARLIRSRKIPGRFAFVGTPDEGNPDTVPTETLRQWEREGIIEWWGWQGDMPAIFSRCHVVCLPSKYREGVPRVLLEAAATGRPVVTTDAPGCREACRDGVSGFLVRPGDSEALANSLAALLGDAKLRARMGDEGRHLMEREFSQDKVIEATLRIYDELLANVREDE